MEFILKTDLNLLPKSIDFNFEDLKNQITERVAYYNALVVTEDSIKDAKKDKASLNSLKTAIEDRRKQIKKQYLEPYEVLEKQCKELVSLIDSPIKSIDSQLQVFEEKLIQEKWLLIENYYKSEAKELEVLVPLEKILPIKWKNKGESTENICNQIGDMLDRIRNELETIENLNSEYKSQMIDVYLRDYSLNKAIAEQKRLEEQKQAIAKAKAEQARVKIETPAPEVKKIEPVVTPEAVRCEPPKMYKVTFSVIGEEGDIKKLGEYMKSNNLKYEVVK